MSKNVIDVKIEYDGIMDDNVAKNLKAQLLSYSLFITDPYRSSTEAFDFAMYSNGTEVVEKTYQEEVENVVNTTVDSNISSTNRGTILPS